jgi:hypothetical protein
MTELNNHAIRDLIDRHGYRRVAESVLSEFGKQCPQLFRVALAGEMRVPLMREIISHLRSCNAFEAADDLEYLLTQEKVGK